MKIYNDYMHDLLIILFYEFLYLFQPCILNIIGYYVYILSSYFNQYIFIPKTTSFDLKKVVVVCDSTIVFCNILNMNYYHLKVIVNNRKHDIRGNRKYVLHNNTFMKHYNTPYFSIYEIPIKKYTQDDCCICLDELGQIRGFCGHQIVCSKCSSLLNKCPLCNYSFIKNSDFLEKILYIL